MVDDTQALTYVERLSDGRHSPHVSLIDTIIALERYNWLGRYYVLTSISCRCEASSPVVMVHPW